MKEIQVFDGDGMSSDDRQVVDSLRQAREMFAESHEEARRREVARKIAQRSLNLNDLVHVQPQKEANGLLYALRYRKGETG